MKKNKYIKYLYALVFGIAMAVIGDSFIPRGQPADYVEPAIQCLGMGRNCSPDSLWGFPFYSSREYGFGVDKDVILWGGFILNVVFWAALFLLVRYLLVKKKGNKNLQGSKLSTLNK